MVKTVPIDVPLGPDYAGKSPIALGGDGSLSYSVRGPDGSDVVAATNSGLTERAAGSGSYSFDLTVDTNWGSFARVILFDAGSELTDVAIDLDLTEIAPAVTPETYRDAGLIARYPFVEGAGTTVSEEFSGTVMNLVGGATWVSDGGAVGSTYPQITTPRWKSVTFSGSGQYGSVTGLLNTPPSDGAIWFWFRFNGTPATNARLLSKWSSTTEGIEVYRNSAGHLVFSLTNLGTAYQATSRRTFSNGRWYHLAIAWGAAGLKLYLDGICEDSNSRTSAWGSGSSDPFVIGAKSLSAAVSSYTPMTVADLTVANRADREEILAAFWRRPWLPVTTEYSRWQVYGQVLAPSLSWENGVMGEPGMLVEDDGSLRMAYSAGWDQGRTGIATSPDNGRTWTKRSDPVLGGGYGGESSHAARADLVKYNGTYVIYYAGISATDDLLRATSSDGETFTKSSTVALAKDAVAGVTGWANSTVLVENDVWHMLVEGRMGTSWAIHYVRSTDGGATFQHVAGPLTSLQVGNGMYGGPQLVKVGDAYELWYHFSESSTLPTHIARATSTNLVDWTRSPFNPAQDMGKVDPADGFDQIGDAVVVQTDGESLLFVVAGNNTSPQSYMVLSTYAGRLENLVTVEHDASIGVGPAVSVGQAIKAKTDNLPEDPASEATVLAAITAAVLSTATAVWDSLTGGLTTVGSIGKWILDKLDVSVGTRASQASVDGLPQSIVGSVVNAGPVEIGDAITAAVNESFARTFAVIGLDSTGWTAFAFVVKESADDDDDQALICVRVSNPGAGSDGLITLNGKAADDATLATLTVDTASPDTSVSVSIDPAGMAIRPSEGRSYTWGLVSWVGDDKATIGRGEFNAGAAIVQANEAP